jgi:hypothetical protein
MVIIKRLSAKLVKFCGPRMRGKVYSYTQRSGGDKKAKGMKKAVIKEIITHENYKHVLLSNRQLWHN